MNNNMNTTMNKLSHSLFAAGMLAVLTTACSSSEEKPDEKPTQAAQEKVETVAVLLGDADKLASKDQLEEALAKYQKALSKEPGNVDARLGIAQVNTKLRKYEEAKTELLTLHQEQPENTAVLVSLGQVHQLTGSFKEGISLYKGAVEKSAKLAEEMTELTKGNVEAIVASSKVAAKGVETLSQEAADFGRRSFEEASATLKSFAEVKSPTDLFRLQSEFARSAFDQLVAESARVSETVVKMTGDVVEPITSRYSVAAERMKTLAAA